MKTLRRSLLVLLLTVGTTACGSSILGPDYHPDGGNYHPDGGNYHPDGGNYNPDGGNYNPDGGNIG
jgi:predicted small lipoprotein YifL